MLPNRLVINLEKWKDDVEKLNAVLTNLLDYSKCSTFIEVGNDINYTIKEVNKFKSKLKKIIEKEASKNGRDIFNNTFSSFRKYKYVELIFSPNLELITSIRLLGISKRNGNKTPLRYVLFNIKNEFDPNIINIVYKSQEIITKYYGRSWSNEVREGEYKQFLEKYLTPTPEYSDNYSKPPYCLMSDFNQQLINMLPKAGPTGITIGPGASVGLTLGAPGVQIGKSIQASMGEPRYDIAGRNNPTWEEFVKDVSDTFDIKTQTEIYKSRKNTYQTTTPLASVLRRGQDLRNRIGNNANPIDCLLYLFNNFINPNNICYLVQNVAKSYIPNLLDYISELSNLEFFNSIDQLDQNIKKQIYEELLKTPATDIYGIFRTIQRSVINGEITLITDSNLVCYNVLSDITVDNDVDFSDILKKIKETSNKELIDLVDSQINRYFSKNTVISIISSFIDLALVFLGCDFKLPKFGLPTFTIKNLYIDFTLDLEQFIYDLLCGLLTELSLLLIDMLYNLDRLDDFFADIFMGFFPKRPGDERENWIKYVELAYRMLLKNSQLRAEGFDQVDPELRQIFETTELSDRISHRANLVNNIVCAEDFELEQFSLNVDAYIDNIKNYTYCEGRQNFSVEDLEDKRSIETLILISQIKRNEENPFIAQQTRVPSGNELSNLLYQLIRQVQSVFTSREILMLINGNYTDTMAQVIRLMCEINFPQLANKVDPIKYFTMLGKVLGTPPERQHII